MQVTPELAEEWLARNMRNRIPSQNKQEQYAKDATSGRWILTGQAIQFDRDGVLIDGQNRLQMITNTGVTIPLMVVWNLDPEAKYVIDSGKARTAADGAAMDGIPKYTAVATIARHAINWDENDLWNNRRPSNERIRKWLLDHDAKAPDSLVQVAVTRAGWMRKLGKGYGGLGAWGFIYMRLAKVDAADAVRFFEVVSDPIGGPDKTDARVALSLRIAKDTPWPSSYYIDLLGLVFSAWNAYRQGLPRQKLTSPKGEGWKPSNLPELV